jgi:hypothetical protein
MQRYFYWLICLVLAGCTSDRSKPWYERVDTTPPRIIEHDFGFEEQSREFLEKYSEDDLKPPMRAEAAFEYLAKTDQFATTAVGFGGSASLESLCINALMARDDTAEVSRSLLDRAQLPGQLYALCGLYVSDRDAYDRLVVPYRSDDRRIDLFSGCIVIGIDVSEIISEIDSGVWPKAFAHVGNRHGVEVAFDEEPVLNKRD